ncbi:MAG: hypothetical protein II956_15890 [Bacteroidales bacterium]|nr:hypothetical protein [Bacteroidales bacterium]
MRKILFLIISALMFSSCFTTHNYVGKYAEMTDFGRTNDTLFAQTKQCYVVGGLVPLGQKKVSAPKTNCDIQTKMTFVDALISGCTFGFFLRQTISVKSVVDPNLRPEHIEKEVKEKKVKEPKEPKIKVPKEKVVKEKKVKEPIPLQESGIEIEVGSGMPYMIDLSLLYKLNNYLSLGFGITSSYVDDAFGGFSSIKDGNTKFSRDDFWLDGFQLKYCLKGNYRFFNKKFSPFVSVELGGYKCKSVHIVGGSTARKKMGLGVSFAGGISYRFNKNNPNDYLGFTIGREKIFGKWDVEDVDYRGDKVTNGIKPRLSTMVLMLTFTHTFNSKWNKLEGKGSNWKLPIGD